MSLRLDAALDADQHAVLAEHLRSCARCRHDWNLMQEADTLMRLGARTPLAPPAHFVASVMIRVAATPVARPILWERLRVEGGRRTQPLMPVGQRVTQPLRPTGPMAVLPMTAARRPDPWLPAVLGSLSAVAAVAVLLVMAVSGRLMVGGVPVNAMVLTTPAGPWVKGATDVVSTGTQTAWHLAVTWLGQVDMVVLGLGVMALAGCAALWLYVVESYLRRTNGERMQM
jgi:hypothetical protein